MTVKDTMTAITDVPLMINGVRVGAGSGATFDRRNPLSETVATRASAATVDDARAAVDAAAAALPAWSALGPGTRRAVLMKAAHELEARAAAFADAMASETGASRLWAGFNVHLGAGMLLEAAALTTQIGGEVIPSDVPGSLAMGLRVPAGVVLGAVVDRSTVERCNALIADALALGATLVCGGPVDTLIMPATVLDHVTPQMKIYRDESFGPVKPVVRVDGVEAAIACANDNAYGLSAAVFGRDIARAWGVAQRIQSGICHINGPTVHDEAQMPFGGVKDSGYGRFGGKAGVEAFTELRWLTLQTAPRHYPF